MDWLMVYVGHQIDLKQFGDKKGASTTHYLIEYVNYILYNMDLNEKRGLSGVMIKSQLK